MLTTSHEAKVAVCSAWAATGGRIRLPELAHAYGINLQLIETWIDEARSGSITVESRINSTEG